MKEGVTRVPMSNDLTAIFPYIMKRRCDSQVYYQVDLNVEPLLALIDEKQNLTFFQALLLALIKTMRDRPWLNRFVMGRRIYERRDIDVCFIARRSMDDEGTETNVKLRVTPEENDAAILGKIDRQIGEAREGGEKEDDATISSLVKLPRFLLRAVVNLLYWMDFHMIFPKDLEKIDPLHCSAYVANLGSVGIDAPFHHLYEWGTCSIFLSIGTIGPKVTVDQSGSPVVRQMVEVKVSLDERIADGYYFARAFDIFKNYIENPETLYVSEFEQRRQSGESEQSDPGGQSGPSDAFGVTQPNFEQFNTE